MSGEEMNDKQKTSNCDMHEALIAYLYDEATPEESALINAHLTGCVTCEQELRAFERVRTVLQQWQIDDLPVLRVVADRSASERSMLAMLKELFSVTPVWAKALGVVAMAMLLLAIIGTDVSVGSGGVSFHADLFRNRRPVEAVNANEAKKSTLNEGSIEQVRTELRSFVNQLIVDSERHQKEEIKLQLVGLESQLQNMRSADLAKLATRIQEHQQRLKTLEQDIDRREGLDLTDILFSEVSKPTERSTGGSD
jgi:putative zinc finger protein